MMGSYHVGSELAMLPTSEVTLPMIRTLVFTYSKISHDNAELRKAFCGVFNYITILYVPVSLGLCFIAENLIIVLLGNRWHSSIPLFKWLALYGCIEGLIFRLTAFLIAFDKQKLLAILGLIRIGVLIPALITLSH
jgi:lipopolysaccharide exporter